MEREVVHINVTAFPIGVERVVNPSLRERPVVVALPGTRSVVLALSREAYLEGVVRGMSVDKARHFCRGLAVVPPNEVLYRRAAAAVYKCAAEYSPLCEPWRPGHLHLDLTGSRKLFGPPLDVAARIQREIRERLRLRNTVGVAENKLVSRVASRVARPRGIFDVFPGQGASFMAPLEIEELPGVGDKTAERMRELNLRLVGEVAAVPLEHLLLAFGPMAPRLQRASHGIDHSPVRPPDRTPVVREEETLAEDDNDDGAILAALLVLVERCGRRLRAMGCRARSVELEVFYADHVRGASAKKLDVPADLDIVLFSAARELIERAWTRRIRLRHLSLSLTDLLRGPFQLGLFDESDEKERGLQSALDAIRVRFGEKVLQRGTLGSSSVARIARLSGRPGSAGRGMERAGSGRCHPAAAPPG